MSDETTIKNYFKLINDGKLCAAECSSCHELVLPPRLFCPNCNSKTTHWKTLSGKGRLSSFTVIHVAGTSYAEDVPYIVAIVQLEEGPSICARLVGVDPLKPEEIHVGDSVMAGFEELPGSTPEESTKRLVFHPA
ncbi:MAG: Zn-ribbon domain-containing OB-fold protein [Candidatus Hodarchaeota archaeon]